MHLEGYEKIFENGTGDLAGKGRCPGGLAVFYRSELRKYVFEFESELKECVLLRYKKGMRSLGVMYLQPECSRYTSSDFYSRLRVEIMNIMEKYHNPELIIGGGGGIGIGE